MDPLTKADLPTSSFPGRFQRGKPSGRRRILGVNHDANCYHVMSRTAGGEMLFGAMEKEAFTRIMRRLERFSGIEVLTYAVMSNHFHLLLRVPNRELFLKQFEGVEGESKLLSHLGLLYSKSFIKALRQELTQLRKQGMAASADELLEKFKRRLCDLETYAKEVKERFTRWFNKCHNRKGTLWMERYKSVVVEDGEALRAMASYIDLNPVRAGLAEDPKDYRWCGYAEAIAGSKRARRGLCRILERPLDSWNQKPIKQAQGSLKSADQYRTQLLQKGHTADTHSHPKPEKPLPHATNQAPQGIEKLGLPDLLRCRVRYFSDGLAIGSKAFIEKLFDNQRDAFSAKRQNGARPIREAPDSGLFTLRALRIRAIE